MTAWQRTDPTKSIKSDWREITVKTFKTPGGGTTTFDTYDREGIEHAGVVALTADNKVIIAEQFRPGPEKVMQDLPGGTLDRGEQPLEAAKRELLEETCYVPGEIEYIGLVYKDAYMNGTWHYFLATNCKKREGEQHLDEDEIVEVKLISIDEFIKNACTGRMIDAQAVLLAYDKLLKIKEKSQ